MDDWMQILKHGRLDAKCDFFLDCCTVPPKITTVICTFMKQPPEDQKKEINVRINISKTRHFLRRKKVSPNLLPTKSHQNCCPQSLIKIVADVVNIPASLKFPFFLISLVVTPKRDQQQSHESESFFDGRLSDCPAE